jgi:hypothetical protein
MEWQNEENYVLRSEFTFGTFKIILSPANCKGSFLLSVRCILRLTISSRIITEEIKYSLTLDFITHTGLRSQEPIYDHQCFSISFLDNYSLRSSWLSPPRTDMREVIMYHACLLLWFTTLASDARKSPITSCGGIDIWRVNVLQGNVFDVKIWHRLVNVDVFE